jgi:tetratricopeptide (TPR) repeat protein
LLLAAICLPIGMGFGLSAVAQGANSPETERDRLHRSEQWALIVKHLPDPATATEHDLELEADILCARRFPEDARDYYKFALARGGDPSRLLNKLGMVELELRHVELGRAYFQRALKSNKKDAEAWNNLGAVDYLDGRVEDAVSDYKHALKLSKRDAVFHSNLGTAYFEEKDYSGARREIATALKLDPRVFTRDDSGAGVTAHLLSSEDRARFSFEMARLYAQNGDQEQMLHALGMASEAGMDIQREMHKDVTLAAFELDPRVVVLVANAQALRTGHGTSARASATPASVNAIVE